MADMTKLLAAVVIGVAGLIGGVLLARLAAPWLHAAGGDAAAAIHTSSSVFATAIAVGVFLVIVHVLAAVLAKIIGTNPALFVAGVSVAALTSHMGTAERFAAQHGSQLGMIVELAGLAVVCALLQTIVFRAGAPSSSAKVASHTAQTSQPRSVGTWCALAVASIFALTIMWLVARCSLTGQVVAAATLGAVGATVLTSLVVGRGCERVLYSVPLLALVCVHVITLFVFQDDPRLLPLFRIMPLHCLAGAMMGTALGVGWAGTLLEGSTENAVAALQADDQPGSDA